MIIINCKSFCSVREKTIFCNKKDYIISIEFIDNEYDEVLIKEIKKYDICCFNLRHEYHNPIGPAYQGYDKYGKLLLETHWINGECIPELGVYGKAHRFSI